MQNFSVSQVYLGEHILMSAPNSTKHKTLIDMLLRFSFWGSIEPHVSRLVSIRSQDSCPGDSRLRQSHVSKQPNEKLGGFDHFQKWIKEEHELLWCCKTWLRKRLNCRSHKEKRELSPLWIACYQCTCWYVRLLQDSLDLHALSIHKTSYISSVLLADAAAAANNSENTLHNRLIFSFTVVKMNAKNTRLLSGAGKQVLLKSVLTAIPAYAMSCFKLPTSLWKKIQSLLTRFWWDSKPNVRKWCWIAWSKLTLPKNLGGLGFRDIECFNQALLAKITWRLIREPQSLLAQTLLGKYCQSSSLRECNCPTSASHRWRGII